jgi:hypothetical protein
MKAVQRVDRKADGSVMLLVVLKVGMTVCCLVATLAEWMAEK